MNRRLDQTHDSTVRSWVASAGKPDTDFPIQNLPLGVFRRKGAPDPGSIGVAIGDEIFDLGRAVMAKDLGALDSAIVEALADPALNRLMALGRPASRQLRRAVHAALRADSPDQQRLAAHLLPMSAAEMLLPCAIGDYTDFYASIHHATNVGSMFRPEQPLMPNYKWVPVGYHGRASSVVPSGTAVRRPVGQLKDDAAPRRCWRRPRRWTTSARSAPGWAAGTRWDKRFRSPRRSIISSGSRC